MKDVFLVFKKWSSFHFWVSKSNSFRRDDKKSLFVFSSHISSIWQHSVVMVAAARQELLLLLCRAVLPSSYKKAYRNGHYLPTSICTTWYLTSCTEKSSSHAVLSPVYHHTTIPSFSSTYLILMHKLLLFYRHAWWGSRHWQLALIWE